MKLLLSAAECRRWIIEDYFHVEHEDSNLLDVEMESVIDEMMPAEFPCAVYVGMSCKGVALEEANFISRDEIVKIYEQIKMHS